MPGTNTSALSQNLVLVRGLRPALVLGGRIPTIAVLRSWISDWSLALRRRACKHGLTLGLAAVNLTCPYVWGQGMLDDLWVSLVSIGNVCMTVELVTEPFHKDVV